MTVFYHDKPAYDDVTSKCYVGTPDGLINTPITQEELENVRTVFQSWSGGHTTTNHAFLFKFKHNLKERDPACFSKQEKQAFDKSDEDEWKQWIANETVSVVSPEEERKIPKGKTIAAAMWYVRTNRGKTNEMLAAKSRIVMPGHRDPQLGLYRTDAPTTSGLAVYVAASIAVSMGWTGELFDVATAFLTGKKLDRELYARAPKEGLPAVKNVKVAPYALLRVLKGAYGLTDAPRLWYLRAREKLQAIGFVELTCARALFRFFNKAGKLVATLTLHVDDGLLFADRSDPCYRKVRLQINETFNIKK